MPAKRIKKSNALLLRDIPLIKKDVIIIADKEKRSIENQAKLLMEMGIEKYFENNAK